jgi:hypothetical protein
MAAAQKSREQRVAPADRAARHQAPAVCVVGDQALVPPVSRRHRVDDHLSTLSREIPNWRAIARLLMPCLK